MVWRQLGVLWKRQKVRLPHAIKPKQISNGLMSKHKSPRRKHSKLFYHLWEEKAFLNKSIKTRTQNEKD